MKAKKLIAKITAAACALSLFAFPVEIPVLTSVVHAEDTTTIDTVDTSGAYQGKVDVTSEVQSPTIKVTIPTSAKFWLNPYRIKIASAGDSQDEVVSEEATISNYSDVAIQMGATLQATKAGNLNLVAKLTGKETDKSAVIYLEMKSDNGYAEAYNAKADNQILLSTTAASKTNMGKIKAREDNGTTAQTGFFQFRGSLNPNSSTAWTDKDTPTVVLTYSFLPVANEL